MGLMSAIYTLKLSLPEDMTVSDKVYDSIDEALLVSESLPVNTASALINQANIAFDHAFLGVMVATIFVLLISIIVLPYLLRSKGISKLIRLIFPQKGAFTPFCSLFYFAD